MEDREREQWLMTYLTRAYGSAKSGEWDESLNDVMGRVVLYTGSFTFPPRESSPAEIEAAWRRNVDAMSAEMQEQALRMVAAALGLAVNLALVIEDQNPGVDASNAIQELALRIASEDA